MKWVFPTYPLRTENRGGQTFVWCVIRRKWLHLTPEEEVRQRLIQFLMNEKEISRGRIGVEKELAYFGKKKRFDVLIYDHFGKPLILGECKAPDVKIDQNTVLQIARYNSVVQAKHLLLTNGGSWIFLSKQENGEFNLESSGWISNY